MVSGIGGNYVGDISKLSDDASVYLSKEKVWRQPWQFSRDFMKEHNQPCFRRFRFPTLQDSRQPNWTAVSLIGSPRIMKEQGCGLNAFKAMSEKFGVTVKINDFVIIE